MSSWQANGLKRLVVITGVENLRVPTYNTTFICEFFANGAGILTNKRSFRKYHKRERGRAELSAGRQPR